MTNDAPTTPGNDAQSAPELAATKASEHDAQRAPEHAAPTASAHAAIAVPGGTRARGEECLLVLASQGVAAELWPGAQGYEVRVPAAELARAEAVLATYRRENRGAPARVHDPRDLEGTPGLGATGVAVAFALVAVHALASRPAFRETLYEGGSADASAILDGEAWRTVTALFLHADLGHLAGNALFGVYFVSAVAHAFGAGLGLALVLAAGALGNALNAVGHAGAHDSIGASTAVFGAIGVLAGRALARLDRSGIRGKRLLLPVGAGLGLLAMLGTGGARVDLFAHVYGLVAGGVLGIVAGLLVRTPPRPAVQLALGVVSAAVVATSFARVLGG